MGKITSETPKGTTTTTTHFSHPHPLKLCNPQQTPNVLSSCSGCKLQPSGLIYSCTVCNYFLHKNCFEMPKKITHPCHKDHPFTLLAQPVYEGGMFNCDACGETGDGFSYYCKPCGIDLHILCFAMPLSITHASHMIHKLELTFGSPYPTKDFCCDICKRVGSDHWIYRCNLCAFDAHLYCAKGVAPVNYNMGFQSHQGPGETFVRNLRSAPPPTHGFGPPYMAATSPPPMQHNFVQQPPAVGIPAGNPALQPNPFTVNRQDNQMFLQALQQIIQNNNAMTQAILAGGAGGLGVSGFGGGGGGGGGGGFGAGGFGGNNGFQQLMQLYNGGGGGQQEFLQAFMNGGFGGGGGGFGAGGFGGNNGFQQLMQLYSGINGGGGGGQQEFLQALTNGGFGGGGGGGELDVLQSLSGGGGGLDFLGGILGGFM